MTPNVEWIEIKPFESIRLAAYVRELRVIRGIAFVTCGGDSQILEMGDRTQFRDENTSAVVSPIGSEPLIVAASDTYTATDWTPLAETHRERLAAEKRLRDTELEFDMLLVK